MNKIEDSDKRKDCAQPQLGIIKTAFDTDSIASTVSYSSDDDELLMNFPSVTSIKRVLDDSKSDEDHLLQNLPTRSKFGRSINNVHYHFNDKDFLKSPRNQSKKLNFKDEIDFSSISKSLLLAKKSIEKSEKFTSEPSVSKGAIEVYPELSKELITLRTVLQSFMIGNRING